MMLRDIGPRLLLLGAMVLLLRGFFEIGVRTWLHRLATEEQFRAYASVAELEAAGFSSMFVRHRYIGYMPAPNYRSGPNAHDALGYRGDAFPLSKPEGEYRIVALGGSTTYTVAVQDYRSSYPHLLERELRDRGFPRVRVINAGVPGYMSWESLANLQFRVLDLEPDMILVYHGVNDVFARMVWPPETYRGDNSGALGPTARAGSEVPWFERSAALRVFRVRFGLNSSAGALERNFAAPAKSGHGWDYWNQVRAGRYPSGLFSRVPAEKMLRRNPPRFFRRNMEGIVALARASGVEPVLVSFSYSQEMADDPLVSEPFRLGISQHNAVTAGIARRYDVPFFDFAAVFPAAPEIWANGFHVNREGAALKARFFADFLVASGLLPEAS